MDTAASLEAYASLCDTLETEFRLFNRTLDPVPDGPDSLERCADRLAALARQLDALSGDDTPTALCLSGGGIRSATFSLGVVESLAQHGLLDKFHYLSTVSGGGYLGGWLSGWIARHPQGLDGVVKALSNIPLTKATQAGAGDSSSSQSPRVATAPGTPPVEGPWPIERLRAYSNYLSPVWGASLDAFTLVATFLRNLWLHWTALVPILVLAVVAARLPLVVGRAVVSPHAIWISTGLAVFLVGVAVGYIGSDLPGRLTGGPGASLPRNHFNKLCLVPLLTAAVLLSWVANWVTPDPHVPDAAAGQLGKAVLAHPDKLLAYFVAWGALLYMVAAGVGLAWRHVRGLVPRRYTYPTIAVGTAAATGAFGGAGLFGYLYLVCGLGRPVTTDWYYAAYGVPALFFVFWLTLTFYVGLARRLTNDDDREWWSRASAVTLLVSIGWAVFMALAVGAAEIVRRLEIHNDIGILAVLSGALTSAWGFWGKRGASIKRSAQSVISKLGLQVLDLAALGFAVLLVVALGVLAEQELFALTSALLPTPTTPRAPYDLRAHLAVAAAALVVGAVTNYLIGVNTFSLHSMYGNRIVRAYLGATNARRRPHWFTGFDPDDNVAMASLVHYDTRKRPRLFHVVNVALNLARAAGDRLEWQQRKATSFTITPQRCGSATLGFVATPDYARSAEMATQAVATTPTPEPAISGITLGRAVTISGAAASPNMGYHTSTLVAFAMSFFNVRLGWWLPNPRRKFKARWQQEEPSFGLFKLLAETFAATGDEQSFVYLSDGGHFENLGLYEMVRRRCRRIVVIDAGEDAEFKYGDLESAVRKIRIDLGVEIDFPNGLPTAESARRTKRSDTVATLTYPDTGATGLILYLKPSLCGDEPLDVQRYAAASRGRPGSAFPHDPTWRQAFDEAQFESYRMLGKHSADKAFDKLFSWAANLEGRPNHAAPEAGSAALPYNASPAASPAAVAPASATIAFSPLLASAILASAALIAGALAVHGSRPAPNIIRLETPGAHDASPDAALARSMADLSARLGELAHAVGPASAPASGVATSPATTLVDALNALDAGLGRDPVPATNIDMRQQVVDLHQQITDLRKSWQQFTDGPRPKQVPDTVLVAMQSSSTQISNSAAAIQALVARTPNAAPPPDLKPITEELAKIRQAIEAASPRHNISGTTPGGRP